MAGRGSRRGKAGLGAAWQGVVQGQARHGETRLGRARQGLAWFKAGPGSARQGSAGQGMVRGLGNKNKKRGGDFLWQGRQK